MNINKTLNQVEEMKMTYNRKEIMTTAWADYKKRNAEYVAKGINRRDPFKNCLKLAWIRAKKEAIRKIENEKYETDRLSYERTAQNQKMPIFSNQAEKDLFYLEMKDSWTDEDYTLARKLQDEISILQDKKQGDVA